jgi:hypothetical protein
VVGSTVVADIGKMTEGGKCNGWQHIAASRFLLGLRQVTVWSMALTQISKSLGLLVPVPFAGLLATGKSWG